MTLGELVLNSREEAVDEVQKKLQEVNDAERWMVAFWCVEDGKLYYKGRVTWDFPNGDGDKAAHFLRKSFVEEPAPEPLKPAQFIEMALRNNGDTEGGEKKNDEE